MFRSLNGINCKWPFYWLFNISILFVATRWMAHTIECVYNILHADTIVKLSRLTRHAALQSALCTLCSNYSWSLGCASHTLFRCGAHIERQKQIRIGQIDTTNWFQAPFSSFFIFNAHNIVYESAHHTNDYI